LGLRIYTDQALSESTSCVVEGQAAHHVAVVLRRQAGDAITLFNGDGFAYQGHLLDCSKRRLSVQITQVGQPACESPVALHLYQGLSKGDRMDWVMQKAVELGAASVTPIQTARGVVRLDATRQAKRQTHWQAVMVSAAEQCGRCVLPVLHPLSALSELILPPGAIGVVCDPEASQSVPMLPTSQAYHLVIGPEGGLTTAECQGMLIKGYQRVSFGPRVLRTETAAVVALALLQAQFGDLSHNM
jgi:16S rRNA (uracil1498-N3)-methyltransferase